MNSDELISEFSMEETRFKEYISSRKCPFRINANGTMEHCDPNCMALVCNEGYDYSCLRLAYINYKAPNVILMQSKV